MRLRYLMHSKISFHHSLRLKYVFYRTFFRTTAIFYLVTHNHRSIQFQNKNPTECLPGHLQRLSVWPLHMAGDCHFTVKRLKHMNIRPWNYWDKFWKLKISSSRFDLVCGRSGVPVVAKMIFFSGSAQISAVFLCLYDSVLGCWKLLYL